MPGWRREREAGWGLQGRVHLSCPLFPAQPPQTLLGPKAPALWLAWPQGSWSWSAQWRGIRLPRSSGTEMASCYRSVPGWGPRGTAHCPSQAPDPDQIGSPVPRACSVPALCTPAVLTFSTPLLLSPHIMGGDTEARLRFAPRASEASLCPSPCTFELCLVTV